LLVYLLLNHDLVKATDNLVNGNKKIAAVFSFTNVRLPQRIKQIQIYCATYVNLIQPFLRIESSKSCVKRHFLE
jgi:hypothetical protein